MASNNRFKTTACLLLAVSLALLASSCAMRMGEISDEEVTDLDKGLDIQVRKTPFDESFRTLGYMIKAYGIDPVPMQCKNIGNETAEKGLPSDLYTMISTCINKVGRQITFIPYDVQYVVSESVTGGKIERIFPKAVVAGGITGFDKDLIEKERKGEIDAAAGGAQVSGKYNAGESVAKISLDLNMLDYKTQAYYPQVQAANSINLRKDKQGWAVSAYYMGCGGEFESNVKTQQGIHMALRMLTEFSVIELFGKYFRVPYWKCIKGANPDVDMIKNMKDYYNDMPEKQQIAELKRMLFLHGYRNINRDTDTLSEIEMDALSKARHQYGASGIPDTLFKLWESVDPAASMNVITQDRKQKQFAAMNAAAENKRMAKVAADEEAAKKVKDAEALKKLQASFDAAIAAGDKFVSENRLDKAAAEYEKASAIAPNAAYPKQQLQKIGNAVAAKRQAGDAYAAAISAGEHFMQTKEYEKAKAEYFRAAAAKPGDEIAANRLAELEKILSAKKPAGIGKINEDEFNND